MLPEIQRLLNPVAMPGKIKDTTDLCICSVNLILPKFQKKNVRFISAILTKYSFYTSATFSVVQY